MKHNTFTNPLKKNRKRVGRGISAGQGKTAGRGHKGQRSRTGKKIRAVFEGGQTPLFMKIPKIKGFKNPNHLEFQVVNLKDFERVEGDLINRETLTLAGLVKTKDPIKILSSGEVSKKYNVTVDAVSSSAKKKIEEAGGSVKTTFTKDEKPSPPEDQTDQTKDTQ